MTTSETELWALAEKKAQCSCGLIEAGYRASWAIQHTERCFVTQMYRELLRALAGEPT